MNQYSELVGPTIKYFRRKCFNSIKLIKQQLMPQADETFVKF